MGDSATEVLSELLYAILKSKVGGDLAIYFKDLYASVINNYIEGEYQRPLIHVQEELGIVHIAWKDVIETPPRDDGVSLANVQPSECINEAL